MRRFLGGLLRRLHHRRPAAGVDREHLHVELHRRGHGFGDRVGNVMKFEIEKHRRARRPNPPHDVRPSAHEQLLADLERADRRGDLGGEREGLLGVGDIKATMIGLCIAAIQTAPPLAASRKSAAPAARHILRANEAPRDRVRK